MDIRTYRDLLKHLQDLDDEQLEQTVQVCLPPPTDTVIELCPVIALGSVEQLELPSTRSCYDNRYHANDLVLLFDYNPFGEDGAIGYNWDAQKKIIDRDNPIYGKDGPTNKEDQLAPEDSVDSQEDYKYVELIVKRRCQDINEERK